MTAERVFMLVVYNAFATFVTVPALDLLGFGPAAVVALFVGVVPMVLLMAWGTWEDSKHDYDDAGL